jgi:hypothetical protein
MSMRPGKAKGPYVGADPIGGGTITVPTTVPTWQPCIPFTFANFTGFAALVGDIQAFSLLAGMTLEGVILKTSTLFTGPGITGVTLSLGLVGDLAKYLSPHDVQAAVAGNNFGTGDRFSIESFTGATSVRLAAISTGANLSALTQGAGCLYVKVATVLP